MVAASSAIAEITFAPLPNLTALAPRWRALQVEINPGPFLTWTFVANLAASFTAPHLFAVRQNGRDIALGLLNSNKNRLFLHQSGDPAQDAIFIEHNGLLLRPGADEVLAPAFRHLASADPVILSGVDDRYHLAAQQAGIITGHQQRFAPAINLSMLEGAFLDNLSANARAQIRRALRLAGPNLAIQRAADLPTAQAYFAEMVDLHQASWLARSKPGAFAGAAMRAFHTTLIDSAYPAGEADLLRITTDGRILGILYTLREGGHVCVYQSGFAPADDPRQKSGLICHIQAIELYRSEGAATYDLLAGADRYKTTLAQTGGRMLHWFTLHPANSIAARTRRLAERAVTRLRR